MTGGRDTGVEQSAVSSPRNSSASCQIRSCRAAVARSVRALGSEWPILHGLRPNVDRAGFDVSERGALCLRLKQLVYGNLVRASASSTTELAWGQSSCIWS